VRPQILLHRALLADVAPTRTRWTCVSLPRRVRERAGVKYDADVVAACVRAFEQGFVFTQP
jgi:hypothetical protein